MSNKDKSAVVCLAVCAVIGALCGFGAEATAQSAAAGAGLAAIFGLFVLGASEGHP